MKKLVRVFCTLLCFFCGLYSQVGAATFHVDTAGNNTTGTGSSSAPWATITHALDNVPDDSIIEVHPGTYTGRIRIRGTFVQGVTVRSQIPYRAKLRHTGTVITAYNHSNGVSGITLEGFDIAHSASGSELLVVHIDGNRDNSVNNITLRNNILHDSYNNDILKVNNSCTDILISGNVFYNQSGSDEHIDINSVSDVIVQDNIFFNDFEGSGRVNQNDTASFIVVKDSNGAEDMFTGSRNIIVRRNIFLNWQGSPGSNFVLLGEDGNDFYEAFDVLVENNLMLGNSANVMRSSFGVKGCRDIIFRNNTILGDLPSSAYSMRLNREGANLRNSNIQFFNNIWSDQNGTMGAVESSGANDFSDTPPDDTLSFSLDNNLYWNGGAVIPEDSSELINYTDDSARVVGNPYLPSPVAVSLPRWDESEGEFADGSSTIRAAFKSLVNYAAPMQESPLVDQANNNFAPDDDILGSTRSSIKDIGAFEQEEQVTLTNSFTIVPILFLLLH
ncbi:MAG: hypothetical protein D3903_06050 [Candidatus Electrothrix sp. GM3_4]|nr:hypothetical protein [Candidatus Electrothrix sp. GM3_4]